MLSPELRNSIVYAAFYRVENTKTASTMSTIHDVRSLLHGHISQDLGIILGVGEHNRDAVKAYVDHHFIQPRAHELVGQSPGKVMKHFNKFSKEEHFVNTIKDLNSGAASSEDVINKIKASAGNRATPPPGGGSGRTSTSPGGGVGNSPPPSGGSPNMWNNLHGMGRPLAGLGAAAIGLGGLYGAYRSMGSFNHLLHGGVKPTSLARFAAPAAVPLAATGLGLAGVAAIRKYQNSPNGGNK